MSDFMENSMGCECSKCNDKSYEIGEITETGTGL